jgi:hypothetical protein
MPYKGAKNTKEDSKEVFRGGDSRPDRRFCFVSFVALW